MLYCSVNFTKTNQINVSDRGLAFGDGVFTTGKVLNGGLEYISEHINRLQHSCSKLAITGVNWQDVEEEIITASANYALATLKVIITAGHSGRGYSRTGATGGNVIVCISEFPQHYQTWQQQGLTLGLSSFKLGLNPALAGIKHLNRLEQVLIRQELEQCNADLQEVDELVVCDLNENIVECNTANIFWLKGRVFYTPNLQLSGVAGLCRARLLSALPAVNIVSSKVSELAQADAIYLCNSLLGVVPVKQFMDKVFNVEESKKLLGKFQ
ncbi:aminodeoxychorismate lyase [Thalassotalea sp. ND16A]|uniref:aminodeoxychorismate lyase n=1 Tax=Thalassotalea sp. ND16A TaxID=1535422 RepID=UPI00051A8187|nr:aminodeoxychorismate lyase [Thalassotalea sp. ND16A]KGJ92761.1 Aminodeoxychorismate lyase [Thalassotalea sp. ND16A]